MHRSDQRASEALCMSMVFGFTAGGGSVKWKEARPPVFAVIGVVTFQSASLEGGSVTFSAVTGPHGASGRADAEGRFSLTTFELDDGAPAGPYRGSVTKSESRVTPDPRAPENLPPFKAEQIHLIPQKDSVPETSGLQAEVRDAEANEFRVELMDAAKNDAGRKPPDERDSLFS